MRPRVVLVVAAGVSLAVSAYAVLAPSALPRWLELREEERALTSEVERARAENARLAAEVKVLQGGEPTSAAVLEKAAREELGWVRRDEIVVTGLPLDAPRVAGPATGGSSAAQPDETEGSGRAARATAPEQAAP